MAVDEPEEFKSLKAEGEGIAAGLLISWIQQALPLACQDYSPQAITSVES